MNAHTLELQLGRLQGTQDMILRELQHAADGRKQQYKSLEEIRNSISNLDGRMTVVEDSLTKFTPTIEEFISIKEKVAGAGRLGKILWILGAALIGAAYKFREELFLWLGK